jgi:riboflavin synthase
MFTGLVQHVGRVVALEHGRSAAVLTVDAAGWSHRPAHGESIAVNGCCLTVTEAEPALLQFDVVAQTLSRTALGELWLGAAVNLEHAVTPTTLLGGHVVQGHVDGVAVVREVRDCGGRVRFEPPVDLMPLIIERGSIAVDGVSLTVAAVDSTCFEISLVPTTLESTTLGTLAPDLRVNIETDYLARVVVHWLQRRDIGPGKSYGHAPSPP